jgi:hypothetical protein
MKKKIVFLAFLIVAIISQVSQVTAQFRENTNVSLFAGGYAAQQNGNNNGYWYGIYAEYMPIKTANGLNIGFCGVASRVEFKSNNTLNFYNGSSNDFGAGIAAGKYAEYLSQKYSGYFGANIMLKSSQDEGLGKSVQQDGQLGTYTMTQDDLIFSTEVNINLLKTFGIRENLFPRSQLKLMYQKPLKSEKVSFWNKSLIQESMLWNKAALGAEFKQSIYQIGRFNTLIEPKIMVGYRHYTGDNSQWISIGPEIALKKRGWDDFLSIYFFVKQQVGDYPQNLNSTQFVLGLNFSPFNIR